ncbi:hypothetical protein ABZ214_26700 [Streptomyces iakyrus]|uniref:effector-associated constant component EACC1 n=1 Tax=Streptomyces iakyrus TaxID=68219 RepID=UPI0033A07B87
MRIDSVALNDVSRREDNFERLTADFADWLTRDEHVRQHVKIRRIRPRRPDGAMSPDWIEWINLVVSSGLSSAALVYAHKNFRASLPRRLRENVRMVIEHGDLRVEVENGTEQDVALVAEIIAAARSRTSTPESALGDASDPERR